MDLHQTLITVFTPSYNRAHTIERVYTSLCDQTCKDFVWLVVDDGSKDNTGSIIETYKEKAPFPIVYVKKENGGRHTAINLAVSMCETPYMVNIDSDDALTPTAIETILSAWKSIPEKDFEHIWQVVGLCEDNISHKIIGQEFPNNINKKKGWRQHKEYIKCKGEKCCCRRTDILKQFPFPVFDDTKFITEAVVWERINELYDSFCINKVLRVYYIDSPDSLVATNGKSIERIKSSWYAAQFFINEHFHQIWYNKNILFSVLNYARCSIILHYSFLQSIKNIKQFLPKLLVTVAFPIMSLYLLFNKVNIQ